MNKILIGLLFEKLYQTLLAIWRMIKFNINIRKNIDNIEKLQVSEDGKYITYKGRVIASYDDLVYQTLFEELYNICKHIESFGFTPCIENVIYSWGQYAKLQFKDIHAIDKAYPWVVENYRQGLQTWHQISESSYDRHLNVVPPTKMVKGGFLAGGVYTHDLSKGGDKVYLACREQDGKYYAKMMTLDEFNNSIKDKISSKPRVNWHLFNAYIIITFS